ncbi:MAG: zinc ribbon domain-containing protein [Bacteroidetes bacterium]|nr:zinc ribbon domain-containing protein [Bacteroidota bacterium]
MILALLRKTKNYSCLPFICMCDNYFLCPRCGNYAHKNQKHTYCINCGTRLISKCPRCSAPIVHPVARFCPDCGGTLVSGAEPQERKTSTRKRYHS